ncbi:hypothetical protein SAMN02745194_02717 [Roseomonas rosea]|uniref:Lipoprotein n=1 Tax=Muricoccus roseus TaxID=198092 RepID=A0A1M6JVY6_9PROT|nr:hypothetical protein [Roseomonas rosea]SHJ50857.1 hypothetical protein SAMN02745194_02717 [Roseomonas rosea]
MLRRLFPCVALLALGGCVQPEPQVVYVQAAPRVGCDTRFNVVNQSSYTVEQLYFSSSSLGSWGNDQLGRNVLPPGRATSYQAANQGAYDFRVVWGNGRAAELRGINVCVASTITITNSGLKAS